MSAENCFETCEEWKTLNDRFSADMDAVFEVMTEASKEDAARREAQMLTNGTAHYDAAPIQKAQSDSRDKFNMILMDRDDAEAEVASCDRSACAAARFCIDRLDTQEVAS